MQDSECKKPKQTKINKQKNNPKPSYDFTDNNFLKHEEIKKKPLIWVLYQTVGNSDFQY